MKKLILSLLAICCMAQASQFPGFVYIPGGREDRILNAFASLSDLVCTIKAMKEKDLVQETFDTKKEILKESFLKKMYDKVSGEVSVSVLGAAINPQPCGLARVKAYFMGTAYVTVGLLQKYKKLKKAPIKTPFGTTRFEERFDQPGELLKRANDFFDQQAKKTLKMR